MVFGVKNKENKVATVEPSNFEEENKKNESDSNESDRPNFVVIGCSVAGKDTFQITLLGKYPLQVGSEIAL